MKSYLTVVIYESSLDRILDSWKELEKIGKSWKLMIHLIGQETLESLKINDSSLFLSSYWTKMI